MKYTFHVLGIPGIRTSKAENCNPFAQKVRLFCKMMTELNHTVYHYGIEGSNPICTENIIISGFFNDSCISEINERKNEKNDFLVCTYGYQNKDISDNISGVIKFELGIGYEHTLDNHRVFESYAWMHYIYGKEGKVKNPSLYDAVIPGYFDPEEFSFSSKKEDYYFFIGRSTSLKGLEVAIKAVEAINGKLIVAGEEAPESKSLNVEYVGKLNAKERNKYMRKAKATFVPTLYIEPFGNVVIESLLCGTPVISTDIGSFSDLIPHGKVGYRCKTLEQFIWAAKNVDKIKPKDCRKWAKDNFSIERISKMYVEYFDIVYRLYNNDGDGWYQLNNERTELNWLNKNYV